MFKWLPLKQSIFQGSCYFCGACCHDISLTFMGKPVKTLKEFQNVLFQKPELDVFSPLGKTQDGLLRFTCSNLNGDLLCQDYNNRPQLCRNYPNIDNIEKSPKECGYKVVVPGKFAKLLTKEKQKNKALALKQRFMLWIKPNI